MTGHDHPKLTEPTLRDHLRVMHRWQPAAALLPTYFVALVAHQREHRKAELQAAS